MMYYITAQLKPNGELDFRPTAEFPALQYLDSIDPGSAADRAGLKPGDFILEVGLTELVPQLIGGNQKLVHLMYLDQFKLSRIARIPVLLGFRPGLTQMGLYNHARGLKLWI